MDATLKVDVQCPDCKSEYMVRDGQKMDIINRKIKEVIKCPVCRRWMFNDA